MNLTPTDGSPWYTNVQINNSLYDIFKNTFYDAIDYAISDIFEDAFYDTFENFFLQKFAYWWQIAIIVIIIESCIGLVGNVLSLIVWNTGNKSSKMACSTYFKILAASDILTLLSGIFGLVLPHFFDITGTNYCAVMGIVVNFLIPLAPQLSAWIIVSISIERMLSLCFPFTFNKQGCKRQAWIASCTILTLLFGINYEMFLCSNFISDDAQGFVLCTCAGDGSGEMVSVSVIWFLSILPLIAVAFCNIVIAVRLCWMNRSSRQLNSTNRQKRLRTFTKLCIGAAVLHSVSVVPLSVTMYFFEETTSIGDDEVEFENLLSDLDSKFTFLAAFVPVCLALFFLNNALNFLLYCFTGTNFRKDLKELCFGSLCKSAPTNS